MYISIFCLAHRCKPHVCASRGETSRDEAYMLCGPHTWNRVGNIHVCRSSFSILSCTYHVSCRLRLIDRSLLLSLLQVSFAIELETYMVCARQNREGTPFPAASSRVWVYPVHTDLLQDRSLTEKKSPVCGLFCQVSCRCILGSFSFGCIQGSLECIQGSFECTLISYRTDLLQEICPRSLAGVSWALLPL